MAICTITAYPEDWDLFSKILKVNLDRGFQVESIENHVVRLTHSHPDMEEEYLLHEPIMSNASQICYIRTFKYAGEYMEDSHADS